MARDLLSLFASALAGVLFALMIQLNATLGRSIGLMESVFVVHLAGALLALLVLRRPMNKIVLGKIQKMPPYLLLTGVIGVLTVLSSNYAVPILGILTAMGLNLSFNMLFCAFGDHFGFYQLPVVPISTRRIFGILCSLIGALCLLGG